jgi:pyruvate,water dikinase
MPARIFFFGAGRSDIASDPRCILDAAPVLGGKGASLHFLSALGYRVPPGFTIATECCMEYLRLGRKWPSGLRAEVEAALRRLEEICGHPGGDGGSLRLAVRSGAELSMPGMMDTVLGVEGVEATLAAVERVFDSWESPRAAAYRREKAIVGLKGTAVNVQLFCDAEAAGVAFTVDPQDGVATVVIEAVPGLGEALVSGRITPQSYRLSRPGLEVVERRTADAPPLLGDGELGELAAGCLRLEERLGHPVDVEWARSGRELWYLQVRAARVASAAVDAHEALCRDLERLRQGAPSAQGWVRHNLDETLSAPSAMTWDVLSEFLSGRGGFGALYRGLGYRPSARVDREGFVVLIGGRVYAELGRAAELFFGTPVLRYDPKLVRSDAETLQAPPTLWAMRGASLVDAAVTLWRWWRASRCVAALRSRALERFEREVLPSYLDWCAAKESQDLGGLDLPALLEEIDVRVHQVLTRFAPEALKLSFFAGAAFAELDDVLERALGLAKGREAARLLVSGLEGDSSVEPRRALQGLAAGEVSIDEFLGRYGHRAAGEMELGTPRWREAPEAVAALARSFAGGQDADVRLAERRRERERVESEASRRFEIEGPEAEGEFRRLLCEVRSLLPWRETSKHHWMRGYDLIRRVLLEVDRRLGLDGAVFDLTRKELRDLAGAGGEISLSVRQRVREQRALRRAWASAHPPAFIAPEDLDGIVTELEDRGGSERADPTQAADAATAPGEDTSFAASALAPGVARGRAWICADTAERCPFSPPYVLVCSSTDPGWAPVLLGASGLVVEQGGALSHGAIVCRDFGLPAVVLPGATRRLASGGWVEVDGGRGAVRMVDSEPAGSEQETLESHGWAWDPGPEPHPARMAAPRVSTTLLGIFVAVLVSIWLVGTPAASERAAAIVGLALDPLADAGWSPFACIATAALAGAVVATLVLLAAGDRRGLKRLRVNLKWYRRRLREAKLRQEAAAARRLDRRRAEAAVHRVIALLKPVSWTFLPLCLAFTWVNERFSAEPLRPGAEFRVVAAVRPQSGEPGDVPRFVRLDPPEGITVVDSAYQRVEPNVAQPEVAPYRAAWLLRAEREGEFEIVLSAAGEKERESVLVSSRRRLGEARGVFSGALAEVWIEHPELRVELPAFAHAALDRVARLVAGGRGLSPEQTAMGPVAAFLVLAVVFALLLQRLAGFR